MAPLFRGTRIILLKIASVVVGGAAAPTNFLDLLTTMDLTFRGEPFVAGPTKVTTDLQGMDYVFRGQPFVTYRKSS